MKTFCPILFILLFTLQSFGQIPPVDVAELALKIGGLTEEELYYGFAEGDQIILNIEEIKEKRLREIMMQDNVRNCEYAKESLPSDKESHAIIFCFVGLRELLFKYTDNIFISQGCCNGYIFTIFEFCDILINNMFMVKTNRERFEDVGGKRVQYILDKFELLGNCANRNNYEYSSEDIQKMFTAIRESLKRAEAKFGEELSKQDKRKFQF